MEQVVSKRKRSGEAAELIFAAEAAKQGFIVLFPHSDDIPYDFAIDNGKNILTIQVKSTAGGDRGVVIEGAKYKSVHFMAIYMHATNEFYIVPIKHMLKFKSRTSIGPKYDKYKNAWHLLTC